MKPEFPLEKLELPKNLQLSYLDFEEEPKIQMSCKKQPNKNNDLFSILTSKEPSDALTIQAESYVRNSSDIIIKQDDDGDYRVISNISPPNNLYDVESIKKDLYKLSSTLFHHKNTIQNLRQKLSKINPINENVKDLVKYGGNLNYKICRQTNINDSICALHKYNEMHSDEQKFHIVNLMMSTQQQNTKLLKESQELIDKMSTIVNNSNDDPQISEEEEIDNSDTIPTPPYFKVFDTDEDSDEFYEEASKITGMPIDQLKKMPKIKYDSLDDLCRKHGLSPKDIQEAGGIIPVPKCKNNNSSGQKGVIIGEQNPAITGQIPTKSHSNKSSGMNCNSCNEFNPYGEPNVGDVYVCYSCKNY